MRVMVTVRLQVVGSTLKTQIDPDETVMLKKRVELTLLPWAEGRSPRTLRRGLS